MGRVAGVLDLREGDTAMIEVTKPDFGRAARIIFVPLGRRRLLVPAHRG